MTVLIRISMALVALAAFALSFATLMALAELAGYGRLCWLYPVTLDLGTVASCAAWMTSKSRQAFHLTWCLLTGSILLNGVEHWLVATGQRPAWWLITAIAMAPPAILGVVTHLAVGLGSPGQRGSVTETPAGAVAPGVSRSDRGGTRDLGKQTRIGAGDSPDRNRGPSLGDGLDRAEAGTPAKDVQTPSLDMRRPDQRGCRPPMAGSSASVSAELRDLTDATPTGEARHTKSLDLAAEPNTGQPGRECDLEPAGLPTRGVSTSELDDTRADNPLSQLIEAGAGRRRIAAELGVTEYRARKLQEASKSGDGS